MRIDERRILAHRRRQVLPRRIDELTRYAALQRPATLFKQMAKADLLVLDDFGLAPLSDQTVRDLLEILDDRYDRASFVRQAPAEWSLRVTASDPGHRISNIRAANRGTKKRTIRGFHES